MYCGLGERELCSPFVVGQSRAEHEAVLELCAHKAVADDFYPGTQGTSVLFLNQVDIYYRYYYYCQYYYHYYRYRYYNYYY